MIVQAVAYINRPDGSKNLDQKEALCVGAKGGEAHLTGGVKRNGGGGNSAIVAAKAIGIGIRRRSQRSSAIGVGIRSSDNRGRR